MNMIFWMYPGDGWGWLIANVLVQVTVIIVVAWTLTQLVGRRNAAWRYSIYTVAIICVLAAPGASILMQSSGIALLPLQQQSPSAATTVSADHAMPTDNVIFRDNDSQSSALALPLADETSISAPHAADSVHPLGQQSPKSLGQQPDRIEHQQSSTAVLSLSSSQVFHLLAGGVLAAWLLGTAFILARWCYGLHLIASLRRAARPLDDEQIAGLLPRVRQAVGTDRLPPLVTVADLGQPVMVGLLRPVVILPESVLRVVHGPDLADILIHECAHAVCRHQLVGFLQRLAVVLFWPHPLVHVLNRALSRAREEVCDNFVLNRSEATRYARTLLRLSQAFEAAPLKPSAIGLFIHCRWRLEDRVADLLDRRRSTMIRVNRFTVAFLAAAFMSITIFIAGTRIVQAEPAEENSPASVVKITEKTTEKTTEITREEKVTEAAANEESESRAASLSKAEKVERRAVNKRVRDFPQDVDLSTPESALAALSRSVANKDLQVAFDLSWVKLDDESVKAAEQVLKKTSDVLGNFDQQILDTEIVEVLIYNDDLAGIVIKSSLLGKPYGVQHFGRIDGKWKNLDWQSSMEYFSPSVAAARESFEKNKDKHWQSFVKIRDDVKNGRTPIYKIKALQQQSLSKAEKDDIKRWQKDTWQMSISLDMPDLEPQVVQYAIFDEDPALDYIEQFDRMRKFDLQQLAKANNEARKEQIRGIQMSVGWNCGFNKVTGNSLYLLAKGSGTGLSSNSSEGKRWIATKTVNIKGKPVCWCIPVEVKTGEKIDVVFNKDNTFDLRSIYDRAIQEPAKKADTDKKEEIRIISPAEAEKSLNKMKKRVEKCIRKKYPDITAFEAIDWGKAEKAKTDNWFVRCKYIAKFQDGKTKIMNQIVTFDLENKLVSVKDVDGYPKQW